MAFESVPMPRRRLRAALLLAVAGLLSTAVPGQAGPLDPQRALVVTGTGTRMATFTLRDEISFVPDDATVALSDGATYGGAAIVSAVGLRVYAGSYRITALEHVSLPNPSAPLHRNPHDLGQNLRRVILTPGSYRVYLFGDGTTEYRVRLITGSALTLRPARPARSSLHTEQRMLDADADGDVDRTVLTHSFTRPNAAITEMQGMLYGPGLTTASTVHVCVRRKSRCTNDVSLGPRDVALTGSSTAGTLVWPGTGSAATNGRYEAVAEFLSERSVVTTIVLAVLQFEL